jgi:hypothetical protein
MLQRPKEKDYPSYYVPYIQLVPDGDLVSILENDLLETVKLFEGISENESEFRYEENKWTIKEVLGHMTDTERVMSYRLLRIGRGDQTPLAGFNERFFANGAQTNKLPIQNILEDFVATRKSSITLIKNMPDEAWDYKGVANELEISANAIAYIIAGHAIHHKEIITERYLTLL